MYTVPKQYKFQESVTDGADATSDCTYTVHSVYTVQYVMVSQYESNFGFFNVFIIRQAHLIPKESKQANFLHILAIFASGN